MDELFSKGNKYYTDKKFDKALECYKKIYNNHNKSFNSRISSLYNIAVCYMKLKRNDEAEKYFKKVISNINTDSDSFLYDIKKNSTYNLVLIYIKFSTTLSELDKIKRAYNMLKLLSSQRNVLKSNEEYNLIIKHAEDEQIEDSILKLENRIHILNKTKNI